MFISGRMSPSEYDTATWPHCLHRVIRNKLGAFGCPTEVVVFGKFRMKAWKGDNGHLFCSETHKLSKPTMIMSTHIDRYWPRNEHTGITRCVPKILVDIGDISFALPQKTS